MLMEDGTPGRFALRGRVVWLAAVALLGATAPVQAAGAPAKSDGIALVPLQMSEGMVVSREDLESAVMRGLAVAGRPVLPSAASVERASRGNGALDCVSPACWSRLGSLVNAGYLVAGSAARDGESFRVRFRLVRAADGTVLASEDNSCEVADCSVAELARRSARELVRTTLGRAGETKVAVAEPAPPPASAAPAAPPVVKAVALRPAPAVDSPRRRWVWPVLAGVGGLAVATGIVFVALDGKSDLNAPVFRGHTATSAPAGVAAIVAGVALAGVATYYIIHDSGDRGSRVALGISPGGLFALGTF
jgi:hypothetical protein